MIKQKVTDDVYYIEYSQNLDTLNDAEKKLIDILSDVCKSTGKLYEIQTKSNHPGSNLYPNDVTKDEIIKAAKDDDQILGRYSVVKRNDKKLVSVPYHEEYKEIFAEITPRLEEAIKLTQQLDGYDSLTVFLKSINDAMKGKSKFEEVLDAYTRERDTKVEFYYGPLVSYADRLFHTKKVFESGVGIKSEKNYSSEDYKKIAIKTIASRGKHNAENTPNVNIRIDDVVCFGGGNADMLISQANMYSYLDPTSMKVAVFTTGAVHKYFERMKETKEKIFSAKINSVYTDAVMQDAVVRYSLLDGLSEILTNSRYPLERLEDSYWAFQEMQGDALAISIAGIHMLTGTTNIEDYRALVMTQILRSVSDYLAIPSALEGIDSSYGKSVIISRLFKTGALYKSLLDGKLNIDFHKAYDVYAQIAEEAIGVITRADADEAREYLSKNADMAVYKKFA